MPSCLPESPLPVLCNSARRCLPHPNVCLHAIDRQPVKFRPGCLTRTCEKGSAQELFFWADLGCLLQPANWRRRSVMTLHPHVAILG